MLRIEEEKDARQKLQIDIEHIPVDEYILKYQDAITSLQSMTEQIRSSLKDQIVLSEKREKLNLEIQSDIVKIGKHWRLISWLSVISCHLLY